MRLPSRAAFAVTLAVVLAALAVPPAAAADGDAVLAPVESHRKAYAWPGGDTAEHVLLTDPTTRVSTVYRTGGGAPVEVATHMDGGNSGVHLPRLLGTTVAIPTRGDSFHSPVSVRFHDLAGGDDVTFPIATGAGERVWAYPAPRTLLVGKPDAADHTRTDLYLRTEQGETKVMDDAHLNGMSAAVLADATGAAVYDGGRMIHYLAFATGAVTRVDDMDAYTDVTARLAYLTPTEVGYRNSAELVRVPRGGTGRTRVAYTGNVDVVRHVGSRLVLTRYRHPSRYDLVTIPDTGGAETVLPVELTDNSLGLPTATEVAAFGILGDGTSGRIAVDVATAAARMLVPLVAPRAPVHGVALSGGRVVVGDEAGIGTRLTQASVDPAAPALAFGARTELATGGWSGYCNGDACTRIAAFGSRTAFIQSTADGRRIVVLDGATEIARTPISYLSANEAFGLGANHLLHRYWNTTYLLDLRTGTDTATTLNDVWGGYGYGVASGAVVRRDLDTGVVDVVRAADGCGINATGVTGRGPWVRWTTYCPGDPYGTHQVGNADTGAVVTLPIWAQALGDGIAVGWDGSTLRSVDLVTADNPITTITTLVPPYDPTFNWGVDETGGRLVAWRERSDETVRVRRLPDPVPTPTALLRSAVPGRVTAGATWRPEFDYSGYGVDWTITVAPGTAHATQQSGSAPSGAVRPALAVTQPRGTYSYTLSVTPRDGSASPADVTGTLVVADPTALALAAPGTVTYGSPVVLAATLTSNGTGVAAQTLTFATRPPGATAWTALGTRTTSASGTATLSHTPAANAEYRATYAATDSYDAAQAARTVGVAARVAAKVNIAKALNGTAITISGTVAPAHTGSVTLQRATSTGGWTNVGTASLSSSAFSVTLRPGATGGYRYRVLRAADADHAAGPSGTVTYTAYRVAIAAVSAAGEYAVLKNTGTTAVNLRWWLLDAGATTERFRLPSYALAPGRSVRVYTRAGTTTASVIYLGRAGGIWAPHDVGRLYDPRGALSSRLSY